MKSGPQRRTSTNSRTQKRGGRNSNKRSPKKNQKQDNTKLFIGLGVGAFFLLFIIIAAASGGSDSGNSSGYSTTKTKEYSLPLAARKTIYKDYVKLDDRLEDEASDKISALSGNELREQGKKIRSEKNRLLQNGKVDLIKKYKKKHPGLTGSYVNKVINEGIDKNW